MLTKKDFKAVAEIIKDSYNYDWCGREMSKVCFNRVAKRFANYFATQNPRFNRQKFLDACGL